MAKFALFFALKGDAVAGLMDRPSDRAAVVSSALEAVGGRLEAYYWMFGPYDGFVIVEVPDSTSAAAVSLAVSSTDALARLETHELFGADEVGALLEKAKAVRASYQPPGG